MHIHTSGTFHLLPLAIYLLYQSCSTILCATSLNTVLYHRNFRRNGTYNSTRYSMSVCVRAWFTTSSDTIECVLVPNPFSSRVTKTRVIVDRWCCIACTCMWRNTTQLNQYSHMESPYFIMPPSLVLMCWTVNTNIHISNNTQHTNF
jgi:hypothetical protein